MKTIYTKKETMTQCEKEFYRTLERYFGSDYKIREQIALNSIISKISNDRYASELNRTIDFGIFDKKTNELKLLIELNDMSHNTPERKERDRKVKDICNKAGYTLITFWTNKPNKPKYIVDTIGKCLGSGKFNNFLRYIIN